jgi:hypothetical protein
MERGAFVVSQYEGDKAWHGCAKEKTANGPVGGRV